MNLNELIEKLQEFQNQNLGLFPIEIYWGAPSDVCFGEVGAIKIVGNNIEIEAK